MLHYNTELGANERNITNPLSLEEEVKVVVLLNRLLMFVNVTKEEHHLLQCFLNHYQNLNHHKSTTEGLWAMDINPADLLKNFNERKESGCLPPLSEERFSKFVSEIAFQIKF